LRHRIFAVLPLLLAAFTAAFAQSNTWTIDPNHSSAQFTVRHMMISNVKGTFSKVTGTVQYDPADPSKSVVDATIDVSTVNTNQEGRDRDLRSANFFDVEKFPTMTFKSKKIEAAGPGKLKMTGDLTIHGVTKEVTFDVDGPSAPIKDQQGNQHTGAEATTRINRRDFGLMYSRMVEGSAVVGDEIQILLDIEMIKRAGQPAAASSGGH
jgi:polyisoprenoid-binding protein YceI